MKKDPRDEEFSRKFHSIFNRDPTPGDIERIGNQIASRIDKKIRHDERETDRRQSFNAMVGSIEEIYGRQVDPEDVYAVINQMDQEEREKTEEKETQRRQRRRFRKKALSGLMTALWLGAAGGTGFAYYNSFQDPFVQAERSRYETRKAEIEEQFFGPLPSLTERHITTMTPRERELTLQIYMGADIGSQLPDQTKIFYEQKLENTIIQARDVGHGELLLLKTDPIDNGILEGYLYKSCRGCDLTSFIEEGEPMLSVIFLEGEVRAIYHQEGRIVQVRDNQMQTIEGMEMILPYTKSAEKLREEFGTLYSRGPNLE